MLLKRLRTWDWQAPDGALAAAEPATTLPPEHDRSPEADREHLLDEEHRLERR